MEEKILNSLKCCRVLQLNSGSSDFGGVSSFLYNVYTHIDTSKVQFDFISPNITTYGIHREDIEKRGGRIYELGVKGNALVTKIELIKRLKEFLAKHDYSIIHINSGNFLFNLLAARTAKKAGVKFRIVHSHNAGDTNHNLVKRLIFYCLKPFLEYYATDLFACSDKAARYMFTKRACNNRQVRIIKNGIELDKFRFNSEKRDLVRKKLKLEDKIVIGHVGRFVEQKNHEYLIKIFNEIQKINDNTVLLLLGSGEKMSEIKQLVNELNLQEHVIFLGVVSDIENIYQAMDVFVMPSFHEGLPVTCIEAQAMGIPCVLSDRITQEVKVNKNVEFLSLNLSPRDWAEKILFFSISNRENDQGQLKKLGYSICSVAKELEDYYINLSIRGEK